MATKTANPFSSGRSGFKPTPQISVNQYKYGTISFLEPQQIPRGAAAASLNWRTQGSKIETRPGYTTLGPTIAGVGKVQGAFTAHTWSGAEQPFAVWGGNLYYYTLATNSWTQIGVNLFGGAAINDLVYFDEYFSPAGAQVWVSSPNSQALIKIMTANPGDYINLFSPSVNFCGYLRISQNAMFMWNYKNLTSGSTNTMKRSYIDAQDYANVADESDGTGTGSQTTFNGTLDTAGGQKTVFGVQISGAIAAAINISNISQNTQAQITTSTPHGLVANDWVYFTGVSGMTQINGQIAVVVSVIDAENFTVTINSVNYTAYSSGGTSQEMEVFTDNYIGGMTSNLGGTGTINYTTGAWTANFNTAPVNSGVILGNYQTENSLNSGIANFTEAFANNVRVAASGTFFLEGSGGALLSDAIYNGQHFPIHQQNIWNLQISTADNDADLINLPYRENLAMQSPRGSVDTDDGIYMINTKNPNWPYLALISYNQLGTQVVPTDLSSEKFNMSNFLFDQAVVTYASIVDATYIIIACRTSNSPINNRMILYNTNLECFDTVDFYASCLFVYQGNLCGGDSITNNVYQFFTGYDDDGAIPYTSWIGNIDNYGVEQLKRCRFFWLEGEMDFNQVLQVYASVDRGNFVLIGTIHGNGSYVDESSGIMIGSEPIGTTPIGGAYAGVISHDHYEVPFQLHLSKFQNIQLLYQTIGIGYASVSLHVHMDIRVNTNKLPTKYRTAPVAGGTVASNSAQNISSYDLSPYLNGSALLFTIPPNLGVAQITSSSSPFVFQQGIDYFVSGTTLTFTSTVTATSMLAAGTTVKVLYTPEPPAQTPPIGVFYLSSQLNGVLSSFTIPANNGILQITSSSAPFVFRDGIDFTVLGTTLTFQSGITPSSMLAAGQSIIIIYFLS